MSIGLFGRWGGRALFASLAFALVAAGPVACSSASSTASPTAGAAAQTLTVALPFTVGNLDPYNIHGGKWGPQLGFGELLMRPNADGTLSPWVLQSLQQTSPTVWDLTIRPHVTFQDGSALDSSALAACMTDQLTKNQGIAAVLPGATVTASGPLTVTLTTKGPVSYLPNLLADQTMFKVFDLKAYDAAAGGSPPGKVLDLAGKGIYTGPYAVQSLTADEMVMTPNEKYWGGKPPLSKVTVQFIADAQARILAVESGEIDVALGAPTQALSVLKGRTDAYFVTAPATNGIGTTRVIFNLHSGQIFADKAVREAFGLSLNYTQIANQVLNGVYTVGTGMYSSGVPYAIQSQDYDPTKAEQILGQDGWAVGSNSIRSKDGRQLTITLLTSPENQDYTPTAVAMQQMLKTVGIGVNIVSVADTPTTMGQKTGWDAALDNDSTIYLSLDPVVPFLEYFTSTGQYNYGGINDPGLDSIGSSLIVNTAPTQRAALLKQAQQIVSDDAYEVFLGEAKYAVVVSPAWKGYVVSQSELFITSSTRPG